MNCKDMMQIPELTEVLKLKAGENGLQKSVRWIYFADCLQCVKSEYKIENYIHGDEFVVLTNPSVTDDSKKLMALIHQMYEYRITALGINEGQISEELIEYCEEKNLPLFELPEKYPLIDLSQIICRKLVLEENDRNAAEQLFSSILDAEHLSRERVMAQARYLNIDLEGSFFVAEFAFTSKKAESGCENEDSLAAGRNVKPMIHSELSGYIKQDILILPQAGSILALIPDREETESCIKEIFSRIVDRAQREYGMDLRIGVGNSKAYLDEVKKSRNEASAALRAAEVSGLKGNIFFYRDQGIYTLLSHVDDTRILDTYVEEKLGKLLQADELNDGKLSETLENYLNCSCNAKKTAEEMFLHRNTLNYRLKKIREILDCDLEKLDTCLELKLAFLIWRYRYHG
nr:PucR family transcriptional regulator [uncultured Blautia sp.]